MPDGVVVVSHSYSRLVQVVLQQHPALPAVLADVEAVGQLVLVGVGGGPLELELLRIVQVDRVEVGHLDAA